MAKHKFKKGDPKPPSSGRKKGVKNKFTTDIKEMVFNALNDSRVGGEEEFIKWIITNNRNRETFYSWLMKMLPSNVDFKGEMRHKIISLPALKKALKEYKENGN